jgi:hypothetical protein
MIGAPVRELGKPDARSNRLHRRRRARAAPRAAHPAGGTLAPFNPAIAGNSVNYNYNYAFSGATGTQFNLGVRYTFK